jgi:uncharacterized RDD family membrane protein YckC
MLLDHIILCFVLVPPLIVLNFFYLDKVEADGWGPIIQLVLFLMLIVYFLKDSFYGRSLAKRITKLQVVNNATGEPASIARGFIRNVFIIMWPVEVLVSLFNPQRRIGDYVAGTKVVTYVISAREKEEEY